MDEFNNLFDEWKKSYNGKLFNPDGIINEKCWINSKPKILSVLKETNSFNGDLRTLFVDDWKAPRYFIWHTLSKWLYGIQKTTVDAFPCYEEAKKIENIKNAFFSSAIINLRKSPGGPNADMERIEIEAIKDSCFIKKEISLVNPDIFLCGSTCDILEKVLEITLRPVIQGDGVIYTDSRGKIYINFWHPAARYPGKMTYYSICSLYQRALQKIS